MARCGRERRAIDLEQHGGAIGDHRRGARCMREHGDLADDTAGLDAALGMRRAPRDERSLDDDEHRVAVRVRREQHAVDDPARRARGELGERGTAQRREQRGLAERDEQRLETLWQ